jgi:hypothetical protein
VKPVLRPSGLTVGNTALPDPVLETLPEMTESVASEVHSSRSPNYVSSRRVPDLHGKILAKIRSNKRRSSGKEKCSGHFRLAATVLAPLTQGPRKECEEAEDCGVAPASPVPGEDLEQYLASVFSICDTYGTGTVRAGALLKYLSRY